MSRSSSILNLAVVGAGRWAANVVRTIGLLPGVHLSCLVARTASSGAALAPEGCAVRSDWRDLLRAPLQADGVILAVPPASQPQIGRGLLEAGIPTMFEKPLALSVAEASDLVSLAERSGVPVLVDHIFLYNAAYRALRARLRTEPALRGVESIGGASGPFRTGWSPLWDWAPHDVSMCVDLLGGEPRVIGATRDVSVGPQGQHAEVLEATLEFPGGVRAHIRAGNGMAVKMRRVAVMTGGGKYVFDDLAEPKLCHVTAAGEQPIQVDGPMPLACAVETFASRIRARGGGLEDMHLGLQVVRTLASIEALLEPRAALA